MLPQLLVTLVNVPVRHDVKRGANEGKQSGVEIDSSVRVQSHVHRDKSFAGDAMGAKFAEAKRRRNLPQQGDDVHVLDLPLGVRVVLRPQHHKLSQVVRTEDGPVAGEVIKVVHDDSNKEIEDQEGTDDEEADEVDIRKVASAAFLFSRIVGLKEKRGLI